MTILTEIQDLASETFRDPKVAAERLMRMGIPMQAVWLGVALVAILAVIVVRLSVLPLPEKDLTDFGRMLSHPLFGPLIQGGSIAMVAAVMAGVGRMFGGKGTFENSLLLFVWLEFLVVLVGIVQTLALFIFPLAGVVISILTVVVFLWAQTQFLRALHGFTNGWLVFLGMIGTLIALSFVLAILMMMLGIVPPQGVA
ncbi:MAG: Yip1 family protein [Paracoccaceae bacterium]|jgi:hypothetical protein